MRGTDKFRVLAAAVLVGAFMTLQLGYCKRDPSTPVAYNTCRVSNGECVCESSDLPTDEGTCGKFECCYRFERHSHARVQTVCVCDHGAPETHTCRKGQPDRETVESCP